MGIWSQYKQRGTALAACVVFVSSLVPVGGWYPSANARGATQTTPALAGQATPVVAGQATPVSAGSLVLGTIHVGFHPVALAVDEYTERVFVVNQGHLYPQPSGYGSVSVLDAVTGALLRTTPVGINPGPIALDEQAGRVFVVNSGPDTFCVPCRRPDTVSVLDAATGALLQSEPVGLQPNAVAVDERIGRVFVANRLQRLNNGFDMDGSLSILDARSGSVVHTVALGNHGGPTAVVVDARAGHAFVLEADDSVRMIDATTGRILQTNRVGIAPKTAVVDERSARLFVPTEGGVQMLDTHSAALVRDLPHSIASVGIVVDDRIGRVITLDTDDLHLLDARSGQILREIEMNAVPSALAVDTHTGRIVVCFASSAYGYDSIAAPPAGTVKVLDAQTGAILKQGISVGTSLDQAVVDERSGHVFVANSAANTVSVLDVSHL